MLPTWDEALDAIGEHDEPRHVARFGARFDAQGVLAGSKDASRCIGYLTTYLTKHLGHCHQAATDAQAAHAARLTDALRYEPCSPTCANWLRYGIQPKNARPGLRPGACKGKAHRREYLGYAGRRVLVSGEWTDPDRGRVKLGEYAEAWITERPGLRPRTTDLYRWLVRKHIEPHLGGTPIGRLSTRMVREWRATLLANGVSVSVTAKAYRLLRAILMTAVEDDNLLPRNPCRIRGAGAEEAAERPVLTVAQVFELAEHVGRRPVGNIRQIPGGYRLRFSRHGEMRTSPEVYASRAEAERAL